MGDKYERGGDARGREPVENGREGGARNDEGIDGPAEKGDMLDRVDGEPVIELTDHAEEEPVIELVDRVEEAPVADPAGQPEGVPVIDSGGAADSVPEKSRAPEEPDTEVPLPAQRREELAGIVEASVTEQEIRRVVEKVVRELYSEKIEGLLVDAVEKTVVREIDRLKNLLRGDGD